MPRWQADFGCSNGERVYGALQLNVASGARESSEGRQRWESSVGNQRLRGKSETSSILSSSSGNPGSSKRMPGDSAQAAESLIIYRQRRKRQLASSQLSMARRLETSTSRY